MRILPQIIQPFSWIQRLLILVLVCNIVLIVWGVHIFPATLVTSDGIGTLMAPLLMQVVVALFVLVSPLSLHRSRESRAVIFLFGALFALSYDGVLFLEYVGNPPKFQCLVPFRG